MKLRDDKPLFIPKHPERLSWYGQPHPAQIHTAQIFILELPDRYIVLKNIHKSSRFEFDDLTHVLLPDGSDKHLRDLDYDMYKYEAWVVYYNPYPYKGFVIYSIAPNYDESKLQPPLSLREWYLVENFDKDDLEIVYCKVGEEIKSKLGFHQQLIRQLNWQEVRYENPAEK